jgi:hypothetical protein
VQEDAASKAAASATENVQSMKLSAEFLVLLVHVMRLRRKRRAQAIDALVRTYVSRCGGWLRAFPSDECGDVYVDVHFNLDEKEPYWIKENFRMARQELERTRMLLGIPDKVVTQNRDCCSGSLAFMMLLYKLSWPRRVSDLRDMFGGTKQRLGRIVNEVACFLYRRFHAKMGSLDRDRMNDDYLRMLCGVHFAKNEVMENIWGFIDGTVRPCCRPVRFQKTVYNGHKKVHAIKFQSVVAWDGMIAHMNGPWVGSRHDSGIFEDSGLHELLDTLPCVTFGRASTPVALYADDGYALSPRVFCPYPDGRMDARHQAFNTSMSKSRITVEWSYGRICSLWRALNLKDNHKIFKSPIGVYYCVATLLTNCVSCIEGGNAITDHAGFRTPTLEDYLRTLSS